MCECCCADAVDYGEVVSGWFLVRARKEGQIMQTGQWGLVFCNGPSVVWTTTPIPNPFEGKTDAEIDALPDDEGWIEKAADFQVTGSPDMCLTACWDLVEACRQSGYNPEEHGDAEWWLFHRMGVMLQSGELKPQEVPPKEPHG